MLKIIHFKTKFIQYLHALTKKFRSASEPTQFKVTIATGSTGAPSSKELNDQPVQCRISGRDSYS